MSMGTGNGAKQRLALGVSYRGTDFSGWESQRGRRTVQDVLERALSEVAASSIRVQCAGRTDAGVHAICQVAHFDSVVSRPDDAWLYGANTLLPPDVAVRWVRRVPGDFHARFSATSRHYRYLLLNRRSRCPLHANGAGWEPRPLCLDAVRAAAPCLVGSHDFSSFRSSGCQASNPNRTVHYIKVEGHGDMVVMDIGADAFLQKMVRNIVGTLIKVGLGQEPPSWVRGVLAERNREAAGATASASGLYLRKVCYPESYGIAEPEPHIYQL